MKCEIRTILLLHERPASPEALALRIMRVDPVVCVSYVQIPSTMHLPAVWYFRGYVPGVGLGRA